MVLSSATVSDIDKSGAIKKRFSTKLKTAKCIPVPEDVKPWVRDAKSWGHDGKKPGKLVPGRRERRSPQAKYR